MKWRIIKINIIRLIIITDHPVLATARDIELSNSLD